METFATLLGAALLLGIHIFLASVMADVAEQKGYSRRKYFHIAFWLSVVGYLVVIALPDMVMREKLDAIMKQASAPEIQNKPSAKGTIEQAKLDDELPQL